MIAPWMRLKGPRRCSSDAGRRFFSSFSPGRSSAWSNQGLEYRHLLGNLGFARFLLFIRGIFLLAFRCMIIALNISCLRALKCGLSHRFRCVGGFCLFIYRYWGFWCSFNLFLLHFLYLLCLIIVLYISHLILRSLMNSKGCIRLINNFWQLNYLIFSYLCWE